ncbi:hypothetical protein BJX99DRAFT_261196 [Aspergillus californicus]
MYSWENGIRQKTEDLYIAVLEAIEAMTEWLNHSFIESTKAFFQQSGYGRELKKLSNDLQDKSLAFGNCVTLCLHKMMQTVHQNVLTAGKKVEQAEHNLSGSIDTVGHQIEQLGNTTTRELSSMEQHIDKLRLDTLSALEGHVQGLTKDIKWRFDQLQNYQRTWMTQAMHNQPPNLKYLDITAIFMPQHMASAIDIAQLLVLLDPKNATNAINPVEGALDRIRTERAFVFFHGRALTPSLQSGISFVIQNPQFHEWFKSSASQILIVQGTDIDVDLSSMVGPLSYMCVMLSQSMSRLDHAYPFAFFCRLHVNEEDKNCSRGLMQSLVTQLLCVLGNRQEYLDLSFLSGQTLQSIQEKNISVLCQVFDELLRYVGIGVIFCMLDGVFWFENNADIEEIHMAMRFLNRLVMNVAASNSGVVFKLLVTSHIPSQYCRDWFPGRLELYMPSKALAFGRHYCQDWSMFLSAEGQHMESAGFR